MFDYVKNLFFGKWYPHWSPDIALRYWPVVKEIKRHSSIKSILDVGSGSLGITPYLKQVVTGLDITFPSPHTRLLKQIKGSVMKTPFNNGSFDAVICVDVLEHLLKSKRKKAVRELIRVAKSVVFIVVPCGESAKKEDLYFLDYFQKQNARKDPFLSEHLQFGLPTKAEILSLIPTGYTVKVKNNVSIWLHRIILNTQFSRSKLMRFISSVVFVLMIPLFSHINFPPTYRTVFIVFKE